MKYIKIIEKNLNKKANIVFKIMQIINYGSHFKNKNDVESVNKIK